MKLRTYFRGRRRSLVVVALGIAAGVAFGPPLATAGVESFKDVVVRNGPEDPVLTKGVGTQAVTINEAITLAGTKGDAPLPVTPVGPTDVKGTVTVVGADGDQALPVAVTATPPPAASTTLRGTSVRDHTGSVTGQYFRYNGTVFLQDEVPEGKVLRAASVSVRIVLPNAACEIQHITVQNLGGGADHISWHPVSQTGDIVVTTAALPANAPADFVGAAGSCPWGNGSSPGELRMEAALSGTLVPAG